MKFTAKINNSSTATQGKFAFYDNIPIFDRLQIRSGGITLENIQGYQNLERIQMLLKSKNELENESKNGNYTIKLGNVTAPLIAAQQQEGVSYTKKLHSGVFSNDQYLSPIHRVAGGLELELD
jgi:hypothetical protein